VGIWRAFMHTRSMQTCKRRRDAKMHGDIVIVCVERCLHYYWLLHRFGGAISGGVGLPGNTQKMLCLVHWSDMNGMQERHHKHQQKHQGQRSTRQHCQHRLTTVRKILGNMRAYQHQPRALPARSAVHVALPLWLHLPMSEGRHLRYSSSRGCTSTTINATTMSPSFWLVSSVRGPCSVSSFVGTSSYQKKGVVCVVLYNQIVQVGGPPISALRIFVSSLAVSQVTRGGGSDIATSTRWMGENADTREPRSLW